MVRLRPMRSDQRPAMGERMIKASGDSMSAIEQSNSRWLAVNCEASPVSEVVRMAIAGMTKKYPNVSIKMTRNKENNCRAYGFLSHTCICSVCCPNK